MGMKKASARRGIGAASRDPHGRVVAYGAGASPTHMPQLRIIYIMLNSVKIDDVGSRSLATELSAGVSKTANAGIRSSAGLLEVSSDGSAAAGDSPTSPACGSNAMIPMPTEAGCACHRCGGAAPTGLVQRPAGSPSWEPRPRGDAFGLRAGCACHRCGARLPLGSCGGRLAAMETWRPTGHAAVPHPLRSGSARSYWRPRRNNGRGSMAERPYSTLNPASPLRASSSDLSARTAKASKPHWRICAS